MNTLLPIIRLLVVDDHPVVRVALSSHLSTYPDIQVVAQAGGGREAIECFRQHQPDVVLMDLRMADMDGIEATEILCREFPTAKIVMLTLSETEEDVYRAISAGAKTYFVKQGESADLIEAIRQAMAGHTTVLPAIAHRLMERLQHTDLTPREREVLKCIAQGMSNDQISTHLFVTEGTIKAHVHSLMKKLQVNDRTSALIVGLKRGVVQLD